ncbi:MAG: acyl-CoA dehydrogenase family protein [Mycobacteriales bacterium]
MDFAFSEEQQMLRAAARAWLADRYPLERVSEVADSPAGWEPQAWEELVGLGWLDPALGVLDTAVLFEEAGYGLLPAPFFSTVALGIPSLTGQVPATLAWAEEGAPRIGDPVRTTAGPGGRLTGRKVWVPDLGPARQIFVVATDGIYSVDPGAAGAELILRSSLDGTRRLGELVLGDTPGERVADLEVLTALRRRAVAAACCEAVGVAQRMLDLAVAHTGSREQFGRPIGSYQGVSHQVANMFVRVELARSLTYWAAWCVSADDAQADTALAGAMAAAGEAAVANSEAAIQVHGGIGFTWEAPLHRFYKRAQWLEAFDGGGRVQRGIVAAAVLAG